jgi:T-complex protein 1 subunit theta
MVVNHIDKIFVTSDTATIFRELEVQHPAAKLIVMASQMQQQEYGDGTNFVVTLAGELLSHAESLIRMGLHPNQVIQGYEQACAKALEYLPTLLAYEVKDFRDEDEVAMLLKPALTSKLPSYGDFLSKEVAKACIMSLPEVATRFDVDNIRIVQVMGSNITDSYTMRGFLVKRDAETTIKSVMAPVVAVYSCSFDTETADTKGTVLLKTADEMLNYAKGE